ncbi:MAG: HAMP domain-containing histidine kinase [Pirellula sp.]|nr:HAMP domain-containing histidine kinase [Pirellula sp.]
MRKRRSILWSLYAVLSIAAIVGAFGLSRTVLELDRRKRESQTNARLEENIRLSLWRLDSLLAPLLSEQALLIGEESTGHSSTSKDGKSRSAGDQPGVLSEFPVRERFFVNLYTDFIKSGDAIKRYTLASLQQRLRDYSRFRSRVIPAGDGQLNLESNQFHGPANNNRTLADNEFSQRSQNFARSNDILLENSVRNGRRDNRDPWWGIPFTPIWANQDLLLVRESELSPSIVQVVEVDWQRLKMELESAIEDLLPEARIVAVDPLPKEGSPDMLVTIPCIIYPGTVVGGGVEKSGEDLSVPVVLFSVWIGVAAALSGIGVTLFGLIRFNDRRERFVAAVTHELRTPLTTLKLYSEMLSEGMVRDEESKQTYLRTLAGEVDRIEHLVENVFAFARLDMAQRELALEDFAISDLIHSLRDQLERMCQRSNIELEIHVPDPTNCRVNGNQSAVTQILINLIDNACKYASSTDRAKVQLLVHNSQSEKSFVAIRVIDNGPGFSEGVQWWRPFSKSVEEAAVTAPGIGIGLSICKKLAKQQGGDLRIDSQPTGTSVELLLAKCNHS